MHILIAEDDNYYMRYLTYSIELAGDHQVTQCHNSSELRNVLSNRINLVILDYNLSDNNGHENFKWIKDHFPEAEVIIVSGQQDIEIAVDLMGQGIFDYIVKNDETKNRIVFALNKLEKQHHLQSRIESLEAEVGQKFELQTNIVSSDSSFTPIYTLIQKAAKSAINVSIYGKTGTGKELIAKSIHYNSNRANAPFIAVNLSALSESILESELFGYEKGAFTGANERRIGRFEEAGNGTLFLDEISEVPLNIQVKLLRVLQEREITRLGSNTPIPITCRIVCASNKQLSEEVANGNFRQDLFYRVIGLPIELPELRHRGNDILVLSKHFTQEYANTIKSTPLDFSEEALKKLTSYHYPGNVRELKSIIDLACVLTEGQTILPEHIVIHENHRDFALMDEELSLKEMNERIINSMLQRHNNNVRLVAKKLQIGKSTIYRILQNHQNQTP